MAIQLIINRDESAESELINLVVASGTARLFHRISGVPSQWKEMYQRIKIQEEFIYVNSLKHITAELPLIGVTSFKIPPHYRAKRIRSTAGRRKDEQIINLVGIQKGMKSMKGYGAV